MKSGPSFKVAIVGSTGAVGEELLGVLEETKFPVGELCLFASKRSHALGKKQHFAGQEYAVQELRSDSFQKEKAEFVFFSAGSKISRQFAPLAVDTGAIVIDNSSAFRMDIQVPLVIPEINPEELKKHKGLIANPNCSTIIMLMVLAPIHRINPIQKIIVSTYQAASGAGTAAMQELKSQAKEYLSVRGQELEPKVFPHPIAFNAFSHDSKLNLETGYNEEEYKMITETHKILKDDKIAISPTCIRIGTFRAHGESIHLELKEQIDLPAITQALEDFPGLCLLDKPEENHFPMPLESSGKYDVFAGRLRRSLSSPKELSLWCCGDQILKGAALNAVQIAHKLL